MNFGVKKNKREEWLHCPISSTTVMDEKKQPLVDGWLFYVNVLGHNKNC